MRPDRLIAFAAEEGGEHAASPGLPQLDMTTWPGQLFWLAVFFGLLYALMAGYFLPRLGGLIARRRAQVKGDLDQAAETRAKVEGAERAYNAALADAKAKARAIAGETRDKVAAELSALQKDADEKAASGVAAAEARIGAMKKSAAAKVREAAADAARAIVGKLIDETPTSEQAAQAVAAAAQAGGA